MRLSFIRLYMNKERLETLVDGVFAIVMTLLVMSLVVPQRSVITSGIGFDTLLWEKFHDMANYALSFIVLALFWVMHHEQSHFIKQTDRVHIWINIFTLMFVALFPFTTSLVNEFPERAASEVIFGLNMFIVSTLFFINWFYATKGRHLVDGGITDEQIQIGRNKCIFLILVSSGALVLSQSHPSISADIFWVIPVIVLIEQILRLCRRFTQA